MLEILKNGLIKTQFEVDLTGGIAVKNKDKKKVGLSSSGSTEKQENSNKENDDYLIRKFRLLSEHTIYGKGYPIDYSKKGLLKKAAPLFSDKTLYKNHWADVDSWVGLVKNAEYIEDENLSGIDAELWLDKKLDDPLQKRLIRGVETGAINRCSVTISFYWEKSHPKMSDKVFFDSLGEIVDEQEVRIIATEIEEVYETSLVWWGADDSAKEKQSQKLSNDNLNKKSLNNNKGRSASKTALNQGKEDKEMIYEKIKEKLKALLGKELSTDIEVEQTVEAIAKEILSLKTEKQNLESQVAKLKKSEEFETKIKQDLKDEVLNLGKIVSGGELGELTKQTIENANYEDLQKFKTEYLEKQDKMFALHCVECGSTNVERRSSVEKQGNSNKENVKLKSFNFI